MIYIKQLAEPLERGWMPGEGAEGDGNGGDREAGFKDGRGEVGETGLRSGGHRGPNCFPVLSLQVVNPWRVL